MITSTNYNRAFWNAMRGRIDAAKDLTEGADSTGAYVLPSEFQMDFGNALAKENLFRRLSTVIRLSSPEGTFQAVASTGSAAWTPESVAFSESADTFTQFPVTSFKLASLIRLKESFINDMNFDLEKYLLNEFACRFGRSEEDAFINGDGTDRPVGILNSGELGVTTASASAIAFDEMIKLYFSLKPEHREKAVFLMHDETAMMLRTLKDTAGNYLWNAANETIFGKPVVTSFNMPIVAAEAKSIVFGDLSYYWILERQCLTVKRLKELYILAGQIGFSAFERLDGKLIRPEAVKTLQMHT